MEKYLQSIFFMNVNSSKIISSVCSTIRLTKLLRAYFVSGTVQGPGNTAQKQNQALRFSAELLCTAAQAVTAHFSGAHPHRP